MGISLQKYFDEHEGKKFSDSISNLKAQIGRHTEIRLDGNFGVTGSTFRAFRAQRLPPSIIYRNWARKTTKLIIEDPSKININIISSENFKNWRRCIAEDLQVEWVKHQNAKLSFAHSNKLIDLFIKWLSEHSLNKSDLPQTFSQNANCALDRKSLGKLNQCLRHALPIKNPSMGDIHTEATYIFCQEAITLFSEFYGGTRLLFDFYAWNSSNESNPLGG